MTRLLRAIRAHFTLATLVGGISLSTYAGAGEVATVCAHSGIEPVELEFRKGIQNEKLIREKFKGKAKQVSLMRDFYAVSHAKASEAELQKFADGLNALYIPASRGKELSMQYALAEARKKDGKGFAEAVMTLANELLPADLNRLPWFLQLRDPLIAQTSVIADTGETIYGANISRRKVKDGFELTVRLSSHPGEPLPYLISQLMHELKHAASYKTWTKLESDERKKVEFSFLDEAPANEVELRSYLALAKKMPELFCNWMHVSWAYGNVVIPLSWSMASLEKSMVDGSLMKWYVTQGEFSQYSYLRSPSGRDMRADLQSQIRAMGLRFVK